MEEERNAKEKSVKIIIIIAAIIVILAIIGYIAINIYISTPRYEDGGVNNFNAGIQNGDSGFQITKNIGEDHDLFQMGYTIDYPTFTVFDWTNGKFIKPYTMIQNSFMPYIYETAIVYNNYANLDYELKRENSDGRELLTISFTGFGYPDNGKGEAVNLDREYVFDITDVTPDTEPTLLTHYDYIDEVNELFGLK